MHVNDDMNTPDDQGRVLVNIGHPEDEEDIFLAPQLSRTVKPHQVNLAKLMETCQVFTQACLIVRSVESAFCTTT